MRNSKVYESVISCIDTILANVGNKIVLALPLGLGKAYAITNALYQRVAQNPALSLHILTALTLEQPRPTNVLSQRFLAPILDRLYKHCPELDYATARRKGNLPANIMVTEFFFTPGQLMNNPKAQQSFLSSNYTHAARDVLRFGVNVVAQMVAPHQSLQKLSLSCNPDVTLDLIAGAKRENSPLFVVGEINPDLPYLYGDGELDRQDFDLLYEDCSKSTPDGTSNLFVIPQKPVSMVDYALALHVSTLIKDGGTLQIGIGSLGDGVAAVLGLRQHENNVYQQLVASIVSDCQFDLRSSLPLEKSSFQTGLYANTEMLVEGLLYLRQQGVLMRQVFPLLGLNQLLLNLYGAESVQSPTITPKLISAIFKAQIVTLPLSLHHFESLQVLGLLSTTVEWCSGQLILQDQIIEPWQQTTEILEPLMLQNQGQFLQGGRYCHAGFYVGSLGFYQQLAGLDQASLHGLNMCSVSYVNHLYDQELLKREQRQQARFVNTCMMMTLTGAAVSDAIKDYQNVGGVGGQYNFVAQAHELETGRSIMCVHSTRFKNAKLVSNIVWQYPQTTIPRHLRDIVVTEYGAADVRGLSDRDVIAKILNISDSRFQADLLNQAKLAGKIENEYQIPEAFKNNVPEHILQKLDTSLFKKHLYYFPLGSDFTKTEMLLAVALELIQQQAGSLTALLRLAALGFSQRHGLHQKFKAELQRMGLQQVDNIKLQFYRYLLFGALHKVELSNRPLIK